MITPVKISLRADRWTPFAYDLALNGVDLTGAGFRMQVRIAADAPGDPVIDLSPTTDPPQRDFD